MLLFSALGCSGQSICVSVDCRDTVRYPATITLNGLTTSADGVKSRLWSIKSGSGSINNVNVDTTFATATTSGLYIYQLTGTSNKGAVGTAFDSVIYVSNKPPVAVVGQSLASTDGTAVLSGSNSTDPEGLPLTYLWSELSGPSTAVITSPTMANPIVSGMINGTYVFKLIVVDKGGLTSTASQLVAVNIPVTQVKTVIVTTVVTTKYFSNNTTTTTTTTNTVTTVP